MIQKMVFLMLAVVTVLLIVLAFSTSMTGDWTTTAQHVAGPIVMIGILGAGLLIAFGRK